MPSSRTARNVVRFMLAWFALYLGAAVASPLLTSGGYAVICSADGIVRLVQTDDAGEPGEARASLHCPLCVPAGAPPPPRSGSRRRRCSRSPTPCVRRRQRGRRPAPQRRPRRAALPARPDPRRGGTSATSRRPSALLHPACKRGLRDRARSSLERISIMERTVWAGALALALPLVGVAQEADDAPPVKTLGVVTVTGGRPTSLPTQIPTTMEGVTREQIERSDQRHRQRGRAQVLSEPAGAQALHRRLQPRRSSRAAPRAPATARARPSMPTASCCPTTSATASAA